MLIEGMKVDVLGQIDGTQESFNHDPDMIEDAYPEKPDC